MLLFVVDRQIVSLVCLCVLRVVATAAVINIDVSIYRWCFDALINIALQIANVSCMTEDRYIFNKGRWPVENAAFNRLTSLSSPICDNICANLAKPRAPEFIAVPLKIRLRMGGKIFFVGLKRLVARAFIPWKKFGTSFCLKLRKLLREGQPSPFSLRSTVSRSGIARSCQMADERIVERNYRGIT